MWELFQNTLLPITTRERGGKIDSKCVGTALALPDLNSAINDETTDQDVGKYTRTSHSGSLVVAILVSWRKNVHSD